jgi:hypothetical protein
MANLAIHQIRANCVASFNYRYPWDTALKVSSTSLKRALLSSCSHETGTRDYTVRGYCRIHGEEWSWCVDESLISVGFYSVRKPAGNRNENKNKTAQVPSESESGSNRSINKAYPYIPVFYPIGGICSVQHLSRTYGGRVLHQG